MARTSGRARGSARCRHRSVLRMGSVLALMCLAVVLSDHRIGMNRILIVDDHPAFRAWARIVLAADGFRIAGEAVDGVTALAEVRRVRPDVVLLDVQLPDADGFDVAEVLLAARPRPAIILTSSRDASAYEADLARTSLPFLSKEDLSGSAIRLLMGGRACPGDG
jgi:DNA-binding NarL/FixJ family response regulator